jgi:hypothetical protein
MDLDEETALLTAIHTVFKPEVLIAAFLAARDDHVMRDWIIALPAIIARTKADIERNQLNPAD